MGVKPMVYVVIPAYNEAANIERTVLRNIAAFAPTGYPFQIIVVNDGSRDATREIVERLGAADSRVGMINHQVNQGVGQGFRTGFQHVLKIAAPDDWLLTIEADNTSDVGILPAMLDRMAAGDDLVLASCYAPGGGVTGIFTFRMALSVLGNTVFRWLFSISGLHTFSSFYRLYRVAVLRRVAERYGERMIDSAGFCCMLEMLVRIRRLEGIRISEVPMILRSEERIGRAI